MNTLRNLFRRESSLNKLSGIKLLKKHKTLEVKAVFVGDDGVGKTNLAWTSERGQPWIGVESLHGRYDYYVADANTVHGKAELHLWSTSGGPDYDRLRPLVYPDAGIFAFVFAIDDPASLRHIEERWIVEVERFCPGIPRVVIGCKSDLRAQRETDSLVATQTGVDLARRLGARHYVECSSQEYAGIEKFIECIGTMAWELYNRSKSEDRSELLKHELSVTLPEEKVKLDQKD